MLEAYKESEANGSKLSKIIEMIGPLFSINSDVKIDLTHSDLDEILNHEKLKQMNFDFNKLLTTQLKLFEQHVTTRLFIEGQALVHASAWFKQLNLWH